MKGHVISVVGDGEHQADDEQRKEEDEAHPRERDDRREESACEILVAPAEVTPDRGGDCSSYQPEDEEDCETDEFTSECPEVAVVVVPMEDMHNKRDP